MRTASQFIQETILHAHHVDDSAHGDIGVTRSPVRVYAWVVFALTLGLLISDYMSRQVLNAVFPLLKEVWGLSDTRLGSLSSVVAMMVGILTFPLSVLADRWGRVRSIVLMATIWSLATLGCAVSTSYDQMLAARALVGIGEAAYGSVGIALVLSIFPAYLRSTLTAAFMAGGSFGSVLGMALGGMVAAQLGWRWSFGAMAAFGFLLVLVYAAVVSEKRLASERPGEGAAARGKPAMRVSFRTLMQGLFSCRSVRCAYVGSGLQLLVPGAMYAWLPSYLNRYYAMAPGKAAVSAAGFVLATGVGMIFCGIVTDVVSKKVPQRKWLVAVLYCLLCFVSLSIALRLPPGTAQIALIGAGMFFSAGACGPSGAMVANLTPPNMHSSAFATLTLANNFLGLAPAAILTGFIADRIGLLGALQIIPFATFVSALAFLLGKRSYTADLQRLNAQRAQAAT
ncbi:Predicted arabinose efflux permease, MFS family [Paraburkholderia susongensis]|uniref:Predicted arabinose efflux permease, MFS family n=1 Tax=Paraburkholderia susongensis TaxID=1515439 RepID=A0A1X7M2E7_9BURK|nr:Predicted arabinose efflux permease, MFS family [Paraburkholderia susongensis]